MMRIPLLGLWLISVAAPSLLAQVPSDAAVRSDGREANKNGFTLFNPTPPQFMRELQTDRPDQTESPYTVDAGHFQLEMDFVSYFYDRRNPDHVDRRFQGLLLGDANLKLGLLNNLDAQLIVTPFVYQHERGEEAFGQRTGIGDTTLRMKLNLFGNDSGALALGLMPYFKFPTNQGGVGNPYGEGGLIVPLNLKLPYTIEIGAMTEFDVFHDGAGSGYHLEWVNSIVLHKDLIKEKLNGYVEYYTSMSREKHAGPLETVDLGLLYAVTPNIQLDTGVNIGLTRRATDFQRVLRNLDSPLAEVGCGPAGQSR